jgi:hypothetical protein
VETAEDLKRGMTNEEWETVYNMSTWPRSVPIFPAFFLQCSVFGIFAHVLVTRLKIIHLFKRKLDAISAVLRNRYYFLRFRFRLVKSSGSGSNLTCHNYGSGSGSISRGPRQRPWAELRVWAWERRGSILLMASVILSNVQQHLYLIFFWWFLCLLTDFFFWEMFCAMLVSYSYNVFWSGNVQPWPSIYLMYVKYKKKP